MAAGELELDGVDDRATVVGLCDLANLLRLEIVGIGKEEDDLGLEGQGAAQGVQMIGSSLGAQQVDQGGCLGFVLRRRRARSGRATPFQLYSQNELSRKIGRVLGW